MNKKKYKITSMLWLLVICCMLTACGKNKQKSGLDEVSQDSQKKLQIVTTIYPPFDFASKVGGDNAEVTMLLKPGMESHSYEPTPADILKIMNSDVFLYAGGESDVWVEKLLAAGETDTKAYALLDWVDPIEEEAVEGMLTRGHSHGHEPAEETKSGHAEAESETDAHVHTDSCEAVHLHEEEYDEHVWTSPKNAMLITKKICEIFGELDPANKSLYEKNAAQYLEKLQKLDDAFWDIVNKAERKTLIFGDRFPLLYFVRNYGLDYYAAFPGCSMETEPSAAMIAFLTDKVKEEQIPVIFYLELSNGKIAEAIAECTGAQTACFYSGHAVTAADLEAGEDYLSLMYRNVDTLKTALGEDK